MTRIWYYIEQCQPPTQFRLFPYAVTDEDGEVTFFPPVNPVHVSHTVLDRPDTRAGAITVPSRSLTTLMHEHGHTVIDLLKMDIEGAEYAVIEHILQSQLVVQQLLVEFHHRFPGVGLQRTLQSIRRLRSAGYKLFAVSASKEEFPFVHHSTL